MAKSIKKLTKAELLKLLAKKPAAELRELVCEHKRTERCGMDYICKDCGAWV